ncbi:MAG: hypothetical protein KIT18_05730 [Burkholderiales bacterium]|nr:hypothetical protein [Burkholderiales bacterium]
MPRSRVARARHANLIADADGLDADALLDLLDGADAWRRPERFGELLTRRWPAGGRRRAWSKIERVWRAAAPSTRT